mgnify:CR=1 FL=1
MTYALFEGFLNGYEEIVQGVIEQAKLIDKNIEIEVSENV